MKSFIKPLLEWYFFNKREFPWRTQVYTDRHLWTYQTWVCEVMSQQTLISVVLPKFKEFIIELPNVDALANCSDELLRYLWSGLGYYARARNLRNGANFILSKYNGQFPTTQKGWLTIPGCGEYTSSIIASICFSEPVPAIDGNMIRVASRLLGLKDHVWEKSGQQKISRFMTETMQDYFSTKEQVLIASPGDFNQAFMDLGATVCRKNNPLCHVCPLRNSCLAYQQNIVELCPPTKPKKETELEQVHALVIVDKKENSYLLVEREKGFLSKTMGFPLFTQKESSLLQGVLNQAQKFEAIAKTFDNTFRHQITHHKITGFVTLLEADWQREKTRELYKRLSLPSKKHWISLLELKKQLSSSLDQKVLKILS